jgi:hypothetical protein
VLNMWRSPYLNRIRLFVRTRASRLNLALIMALFRSTRPGNFFKRISVLNPLAVGLRLFNRPKFVAGR